MADHKGGMTGGRYCTVSCSCGWRGNQWFSPRDAWDEFREHEQEVIAGDTRL